MRTHVGIALALSLLIGCSTPAASTAAPSASAAPTAATRSPAPAGLDAPVPAKAVLKRRWFTLPNGLDGEPTAGVYAQFEADATAGTPVARLRSSRREGAFVGSSGPNLLAAAIDIRGLDPGVYAVDVVEHLRSGGEAIVATTEIVVSAPVYVVWTLDFEGDAASDEALANTAAIADGPPGFQIPMTIMWNPRIWTTTQVGTERAEAMRAWTSRRAGYDEVGLHIHAWTDFVKAAGVAPRTAPNWSGRSDGYDVPLTAFSEQETRTIVEYGVKLMKEHGLPIPTTFRGGGLFANAANLRAVSAAGFTVDTSGTPAGAFGRLPLPWTLAKDAQPYRPSRDDANVPGDLPLLEVPNIAGNTYGYTASSIQRTINDDIAMLGPAGEPATARRVLTLVSHPATIDGTERRAIEALFGALAPYSYAADRGPLRFVTMSQLAQALR